MNFLMARQWKKPNIFQLEVLKLMRFIIMDLLLIFIPILLLQLGSIYIPVSFSRRYADVMVHRQLLAALQSPPLEPLVNDLELSEICAVKTT